MVGVGIFSRRETKNVNEFFLGGRDAVPTVVTAALPAALVAVILLSVVLAQQKWQLIVNLMALSWGLLAGCFLGPFVWGLSWGRVSRLAVWVNIIFALVFMGGRGYHYASDKLTAGYVPVLAALTMLASLVITPLVSLISPAPARDIVDRAFGEGGAAQPTPLAGEPISEGESA